MEFIKNLYQDEIRDGWLVKSDMKRVWQRQLEIWQEVDRICRKHKITYWAAYGTLLGAARHKGFIPWDEDFDLWMMRPDYNRFYDVVEEELFQSGGLFEIAIKLPNCIKISHSQTTLLAGENIDKEIPKGILLDIFPLDVGFDGTEEGFLATNSLNEVMGTIYNYPAILKHVQDGGKTISDWGLIDMVHNLPDESQQNEFMNVFAERVFDWSSKVMWIEKIIYNRQNLPQPKSCYEETIYLPFETIELPVPIDYDKVLACCYGDWRKPVIDRGGKLGFIYSTDIPYREFLQRVDLKFMFPELENHVPKD